MFGCSFSSVGAMGDSSLSISQSMGDPVWLAPLEEVLQEAQQGNLDAQYRLGMATFLASRILLVRLFG